MSDFDLDAAKRPSVTITTRSDDGETCEHHFEVLPLTKPRYDAFMAAQKKARQLADDVATNGSANEEQEAAAEALMVSAVGQRLRSTNGPVSIKSLWESELLGLEHLRALGEYLYKELADPPSLSAQRLYAFWALKAGWTPAQVDALPVDQSAGWLLDQAVRLATNPELWWNSGGPLGFGDDDPEYDPAFDAAVEPPPGWENLPWDESGVSGGE